MIDLVPAPATLPPGKRVYAIGDVHGCIDRLISLHALITEDLEERPVEAATLIHLGDYVDRGPDSAQVVNWLHAGDSVPATTVVNLMGNHEEMMLKALATGADDAVSHWLANGGTETLVSWGVGRAVPPDQWARHIDREHLVFLRDLAIRRQVGPYLFVHAGIRPGIALERQSRQDLLWIREPFLSSREDHGVVVVHGHTPRQEPTVRANRIGIDTGAVIGGALTCVVLEGGLMGFIRG
jgi:serine/threonine protein phosphatase 1